MRRCDGATAIEPFTAPSAREVLHRIGLGQHAVAEARAKNLFDAQQQFDTFQAAKAQFPLQMGCRNH